MYRVHPGISWDRVERLCAADTYNPAVFICGPDGERPQLFENDVPTFEAIVCVAKGHTYYIGRCAVCKDLFATFVAIPNKYVCQCGIEHDGFPATPIYPHASEQPVAHDAKVE